MTEQQVRIFTSSDGQAQLEVALDQETVVWLSQAQMGQLFDTTPENALMHLTSSKMKNWPNRQLLRIS